MKHSVIVSAQELTRMMKGRRLGPNSPLLETSSPRGPRRGRPEDDRQRGTIIPAWDAAGFHVNVTSARGHAKGVTAGIPDLYLQHRIHALDVWHEVKLDTRLSIFQDQFRNRCQQNGSYYVVGDQYAVADFLLWMGLASLNGRRPTYEGFNKFPSDWFETETFDSHLSKWGWKPPTGRKRKRSIG